MNNCFFLQKAGLYRAQQPAIVFGDESISYAEFYRRALVLAGNFAALGLTAGDRIAFCLQNSPRILEIIYACFAGGYVVVPINARLHAKESAYILQNSGASIFFHDPEMERSIGENASEFAGLRHRYAVRPSGASAYPDELTNAARATQEPVELAGDAPAWIFYTSGTTGKPKGALWTHRIVRVMIMNYLADLYNIAPGEMVLHCAPLSHGSGIIALPAVARGACNVIYNRPNFEPEALFAQIAQHRISHVAFMAPTQIVKCLEAMPARHDLSSLRGICYGGAPIYMEHLKQALEAFGPIFIQLYGQGEAPITITGMSAQEHRAFMDANDPRLGSAGRIRTDVEAHCVGADGARLPPGEAGEIVVRGDVVMKGYWENAEASAQTLAGGWLHTGDIGAFDKDGYLFLLDRSKDVIITGGNNVYPREVEEVLVQHAAVATSVVVGIPDKYWGEAVHAVVVLNPGMKCSAEALIRHCGESLAGYKKPKSVEFVSELPVSGYGKVLRREVRSKYWEGTGSQIGGGTGTPGSRKDRGI